MPQIASSGKKKRNRNRNSEHTYKKKKQESKKKQEQKQRTNLRVVIEKRKNCRKFHPLSTQLRNNSNQLQSKDKE